MKKWFEPRSILVGILIAILLPLLVLMTGMVNMGADQTPGKFERTFAGLAKNRSIAVHKSSDTNPVHNDPATLASGLVLFRENCVMCHGAPSVEPAPFAKGLNPHAPSLNKGQRHDPDDETFWIIKHGMRITGMPALDTARTNDDVWKLVTFVHHLPDLTKQEQDSLRIGIIH
jgi:mono/diheme cytochrome c family protein